LALDDAQPIWVDAVAFSQALADETADPEAVEAALALYRGPFLAGVFAPESRGLEEWTAVTRERLQQEAIAGRRRLADHYLHRRQIERALPHAQALVQLDPLREQSQRLLMRLLARAGRHNAALRQYQRCCEVLDAELDVSPAPETKRLYRRIRRAKDPPPHRAPPQFTPFVGRRAELAALGRRLDDPDCRLLTLTGPGGAGKTRLAAQAAADRRGEYLDGIYFVPLAGVETAVDLTLAVAQRLGVKLEGEKAALAQLTAHLAEREMLLILDNFEQLDTAGAPLLQAILQEAPDVTLLLTSRQRLRLRAEWVLPLGGMALDATETEGSEAVALFQSCARQGHPDVIWDEATKTAVSRICRLLEGLPLGIELAAATLPDHPAAQIAAALEETLDLLKSPWRDTPQRHRSLRAAFLHSWNLLAAAEQAAFARLAVFGGDFGPAAARAAAAADSAMLRTLAAKSLLRPAGAGRYAMHAVLRQYGREKLAERGEEERVYGRYAEFFAEFLRERDAALDGGTEQLTALAEVEAERDNINAAWRWTVQHGAAEQLNAYVAGLQHWYRLRGLYREGTATFAAAIAALRRRPTLSSPQEVTLGHLLAHYGFYLFRLGRYEAGRARLEESLAILRRHELPQQMVKPLGGLANVAFMQGKLDEAERRYRELLTLCRRLEAANGVAGSLEGLANVADARGRYEQAINWLEESLALRREAADSHALANSLSNLAVVYYNKSDYAKSISLLQEALALWEQIGDTYSQIITLTNLGEATIEQGKLAEAEEIYRRVLALSRETNRAIGQPSGYWGLGEIKRRRGAWEAAAVAFRASLETAVRDFHKLRALLGYAQARLAQGRGEEVAALLDLAQRHPAATAEVKATAAASLAELPSPPREKALDLETAVAEILTY
jgi:predicted ATPase/Tfp pilus assembly protein PilF